MNARELVGSLPLHDSVISKLVYQPDIHSLAFELELCESNENEPAADRQGWLVFNSISDLNSDPDISEFHISAPTSDGEILQVKILSEKTEGPDRIEFVIQRTLYENQTQDILVLRFDCQSIDWKKSEICES